MQIGSLKLKNNIVLAPLAGITNLPFRLLAKEAGCGLVCSEMVSAKGLVHHSPKTERLLASSAEEKPVSVQLFGADPEDMAAAASAVEASGADVVDINFGCAVGKVVKTGAGAALMKAPARAEAILKAVGRSVGIPLTIKIRAGWTASGEQAVQIAKMAQDAGAAAVSVHPRTAGQGFRGEADWRIIRLVKNELKIPVIGNGDIRSAEDAVRMRAQTGCDGVMVGRRAIGYPWIFSQIRAAFDGQPPEMPTLEQRFEAMERYVTASVACLGEEIACRLLRSRLGWFVKGLPHAGKFREDIKRIESRDEVIARLGAYRDVLSRQPVTCA